MEAGAFLRKLALLIVLDVVVARFEKCSFSVKIKTFGDEIYWVLAALLEERKLKHCKTKGESK